MGSKLLAYALDFTSFLIQKANFREEIKNVILFGSVAREEAGEGSDVDLFIDLVKDSPEIEAACSKIRDDFLDSSKYKNYWQLLGIQNNIALTVGELERWDLKSSIIANGITLLGKFTAESGGEHKVFLIWENIKPNATRVLLNKQLLGYNQHQKFYAGLLQKYHGERLGKGCILIPLEHFTVFSKLFRKHKVAVKIKKVREY